MPRLYNLNSHKLLRKQLRCSATPAERHLWCFLKKDQLLGYRFRRQFSIGRYIIDFYCPKLRLAIEIEGEIHQSSKVQENDLVRQRFLESCFIRIIRFTNNEVLNQTVGVLKIIERYITSLSAFDETQAVSPF